MPRLAFVLPIGLTAIGLAIAAMIRSVKFEGMGAFLVPLAGVTAGGWAMSLLAPFILPNGFGSGRGDYIAMYGGALVINIAALGLTSLVIDGFKIRGGVGLLAAGVVVTLVENSLVLVHVARLIGR